MERMEGKLINTNEGWRVEYLHYEGTHLSVLRVIPIHPDSMYREPTWYEGMAVRFNIEDRAASIFHGRNPNEQQMNVRDEVPSWIHQKLQSNDECERMLAKMVINDSEGMDIFENLKSIIK